MTRSLVFDTETTGLLLRGADAWGQPRVVQLAAILLDGGREVASASLIVRPDIPIPLEASNIHGITDDVARAFGVPEKAAVGLFLRLCQVADLLVAHNADFDVAVLRGAAERWGIEWRAPSEVRCTMLATRALCAIPPTARMLDAGYADFKPPSLKEAYRRVCGVELIGAHHAMVDARACSQIYLSLPAETWAA